MSVKTRQSTYQPPAPQYGTPFWPILISQGHARRHCGQMTHLCDMVGLLLQIAKGLHRCSAPALQRLPGDFSRLLNGVGCAASRIKHGICRKRRWSRSRLVTIIWVIEGKRWLVRSVEGRCEGGCGTKRGHSSFMCF